MPTLSFGETGMGINSSDITISTIPESIEPYQNITIKIQSYAVDLNKANIIWKNGSKVVLSGYGKVSYSFTTPGSNVNTIFNVTINPANSLESITKTISINPSEISVLWESADGYTPPFYKGKSFAPSKGKIKVVAIPNTTKNNITYYWKRSDEGIANASGYNKNSFSFKNNELNASEEIKVTASSVDGKYNASKTINIPISQPKIIFYKKSPTEGVLYNQALIDKTIMKEDEMTIIAIPYFFSIKGNERDLNYNWKINGDEIDTPSKKTELTVRPVSRGGDATINFSLENLSTFFQKASSQLKLIL